MAVNELCNFVFTLFGKRSTEKRNFPALVHRMSRALESATAQLLHARRQESAVNGQRDAVDERGALREQVEHHIRDLRAVVVCVDCQYYEYC